MENLPEDNKNSLTNTLCLDYVTKESSGQTIVYLWELAEFFGAN